MNISTHFDYNNHIAFISTHSCPTRARLGSGVETNKNTLHMKRHHYCANESEFVNSKRSLVSGPEYSLRAKNSLGTRLIFASYSDCRS